MSLSRLSLTRIRRNIIPSFSNPRRHLSLYIGPLGLTSLHTQNSTLSLATEKNKNKNKNKNKKTLREFLEKL